MYYKIENKECEVYQKLRKMRAEEIQIGKDNEKAIEEKTGLKFESFLGRSGQQNFCRTPQYRGFQFTEPEKVDLKIWKQDKKRPEIFVPNKRTKLGREMDEFLVDGLKSSLYSRPFDILGIPETNGRFTFPFVEVVNDIVLIFLGSESPEPQDENVIEITKREFSELLSKQNKD